MVFDFDSPPDNEEEIAAAKEDARKLLRLRTKSAIYATGAFFLSCASVVPFLYGHPLHSYWEPIGKYLVLLSMGLLVPFGILAGIAINTWFYAREVEKIEE
jgi:hypothetical protein